MSFEIKLITGTAPQVRKALYRAIQQSRFVCDIEIGRPTRDTRYPGGKVVLRTVRLRESKPYCGNHPGPCLLTGRKHRRTHLLEGADWIDYNSLLNDVLDRLRVEADVRSSHCVIRVGRHRRVRYGAYNLLGFHNHLDWEKTGHKSDYEDCIGRDAPPSTFPAGTPGHYTRTNYRKVG